MYPNDLVAAKCAMPSGLATQANPPAKALALDVLTKDIAAAVAHFQHLLGRVANVADRVFGEEPGDPKAEGNPPATGSLGNIENLLGTMRLVASGLERQIERIERL